MKFHILLELPGQKPWKNCLPDEIIESNCWQYEYFNVTEKKIKQCKICSPFQHFCGSGFTFIHNFYNL